MQNGFKSHINFCLILGTALTLLASCAKGGNFPDEPELTSIQFITNPDSSGVIKVGFTDGDGNIGLSDSDTLPPYNFGSRTYYNLFVEYFELQNGTWVMREFETPFYYRIEPIEPDGRLKQLEGDIEVLLALPYYFDPTSNFDTIKYSVSIMDRDLNESNALETNIIITP